MHLRCWILLWSGQHQRGRGQGSDVGRVLIQEARDAARVAPASGHEHEEAGQRLQESERHEAEQRDENDEQQAVDQVQAKIG